MKNEMKNYALKGYTSRYACRISGRSFTFEEYSFPLQTQSITQISSGFNPKLCRYQINPTQDHGNSLHPFGRSCNAWVSQNVALFVCRESKALLCTGSHLQCTSSTSWVASSAFFLFRVCLTWCTLDILHHHRVASVFLVRVGVFFFFFFGEKLSLSREICCRIVLCSSSLQRLMPSWKQ